MLPMSLMLFLTGSMTHADSAKVQLGYRKATYHWPAFAKDSFTRSFTLINKRDTSVRSLTCSLFFKTEVSAGLCVHSMTCHDEFTVHFSLYALSCHFETFLFIFVLLPPNPIYITSGRASRDCGIQLRAQEPAGESCVYHQQIDALRQNCPRQVHQRPPPSAFSFFFVFETEQQ